MDCNDTNICGLNFDGKGDVKVQIHFIPCKSLVEHCTPPTPHLSIHERTNLTSEIYLYLADAFLLMPWYVAFPLWNIQKLFKFFAFITSGKNFRHLSEAQREIFINKWCKFGRPFEALIRLYRSFVLLIYFEHPLIGVHS